MTVLLVSYHYYNYSSEGLVTAKLARALTDAGHAVRVYTSTHNWLDHDDSEVRKDLVTGIPTECIASDAAAAPVWWRGIERVRQHFPWLGARLSVIPGLSYGGCYVEEFGWVRRTAAAITLALARDGLSDTVVLSRLNPFHSHLVPLLVRRRFPKLAWCAYFSDPWPYHLYPAPYAFTVGKVSRWRQEHMLARILREAGSVLFPSARLSRHMLSGPRTRFQTKAFVAPHLGRIPPATEPKARTDQLVIRHAGLLMKERKTEPLFNGLRQFLDSTPGARSRVRLEFTGRGEPETPADLAANVGVTFYHFPDTIGAWLDDADVLLLVEAAGLRDGVFMPSKLADYLTSSRPILALSPKIGTVADYLKDGGGLLVEPDDVEGIAAALRRLYDRWQNGTLSKLAPSPAQARRVSPEAVVPIYEQAFAHACANR